ncbi:MAG: hypothetical protein O3B01_19170 [Planctomycetota bacterium]|nr:hypothetical protein [Planctomycetota bacterium]
MALEVVILRELQESARKNQTYWLRMGYGAVLATPVFFTVLTLSMDRTPAQGIGRQLFTIFSYWQFGLFVLLSPAAAASSIVEERDSGTLGLLMLTRLTPVSILLGKLGVQFIRSSLLLLSGLPLLFMATMFGGVAPAQILGAFGSTLLTVFMLTALGLAVSALSDQNYKAVVATFLIMLIGGILLPICLYLIGWGTDNSTIVHTLLRVVHPAYVFADSVAGVLTLGAAIKFVVCTLLLSTVFLMMGRAGIRRTFIPRESEQKKQDTSGPGSTREAHKPVPSTRNAKSRGEIKGRPIVWRDARRTFGLNAAVGGFYISLLAVVFACFAFRTRLFGFSSQDLTIFATIVSRGSWLFIYLAVFVRSCLLFAQEKEPGVMASLLMTPMTDRQIILDKLRVLWKEYGLVLIGLIILSIGINFPELSLSMGGRLGFTDQRYPMASLIANLIGLVFYACVGMFWSIMASTPGKALAYSIISLLLYKMVSLFVIQIGFMALRLGVGRVFFIIPAVINLIIALGLFSWMARNLRRQTQKG